MVNRVLRYVFVASDVLVGLFALLGGMNAVMGVHVGFTFGHALAGLTVLSFALAMLAAGYTVAKGLAWQRVLRSALYILLVGAFGSALLYKVRHSIPDRSFEVYALVFLVANLSAYVLWVRRTRQAKG